MWRAAGLEASTFAGDANSALPSSSDAIEALFATVLGNAVAVDVEGLSTSPELTFDAADAAGIRDADVTAGDGDDSAGPSDVVATAGTLIEVVASRC